MKSVAVFFCIAFFVFATTNSQPSAVSTGGTDGQGGTNPVDNQMPPVSSTFNGDPCPGNEVRVGSMCVHRD